MSVDQAERLDYGPQNCHRPGQWGKWRGVLCAVDECNEPVSCRGFCKSHYSKKKAADGHRPPSATPANFRRARIKHRYGITADEYDGLLAAQDGKCAVCGQPPSDRNTRAHWSGKLCIDHDHTTGAVRGLLCNDCNLAIGYARSEATARAMVKYFRLHNGPDRQH